MDININESGFGQDELAAAKHLGLELEAFFAQSPCEGEINILNFQLPPGYIERDIDILVLLKIADGYVAQFNSNGTKIEMEGGFIFNIETKSHSHFELHGKDILVKYSDGTKKNATKQAWNVKNHLLNYLKKHFPGRVPWVYDIVYLPMCSRETSLEIFGSKEFIPKNFLDGSMTAEELFQVIIHDNNLANTRYGSTRSVGEIDAIKKFVSGTKLLPKQFANRLELLTINSLKVEQGQLFEDPNNYYILRGSPGAGKTILMLSKCLDLLSRGKKCLYLTYNKQLVLDLERLQEAIKSIAPSNPLISLRIETWESFVNRVHSFYNYFRPLGSAVPNFEDKATEVLKRYSKLERELLAKDEEKNSRNIFKYSAVDYVFIDEAQDLPTSVFEILKVFFSNNICLAVGDQQEYKSIEQRVTSNEIYLEKIHRQKEVPSQIVRSFLERTELEHMYQMQKPVPLQLVGGDSIVYIGLINEGFYEDIFKYIEQQGGAKIDFLHLHIKDGDSAANTTILHYCGGNVVEGVNIKLDKFRYYHYNSCRGLEGSVVLYEKIDSYYEWCVSKFGEEQAKKRIFIALTRVKDIAVFTFTDLNHWLYKDVIANLSTIKNTFHLA